MAKTIVIQGKETPLHEEHPIRVSCMEHIETELDDYVNYHDVAPDTFSIDEVELGDIQSTCMECNQPGKIVLLHVKGM
ncbi:CxxH/CxxC protein [Brevibacillus laterosporus]|uniref:CxxH/CxxC protein n=1 Tax=Brevibacillus laterosporus TaxID=1465 RepID=UPI003D240D81